MDNDAGPHQWRAEHNTTLLALLDAACESAPDKPFLDVDGHVLTYRELDVASTRLARGLVRVGVRHGDRVSCLMDNAIESVLGWFAVNKLGAIFVPVNTALDGEFLRHQLSDAACAVMLVGPHYADRVLALEDELPALETLIVSGERAASDSRVRCVRFADLPDGGSAPVGPHPAPTDLAMLIYTSGTTGPSKGCMISHSYAVRAGRQMALNTCMTADDIAWTPCPLFHAAATLGLIVNVLSVGGTAAIARKFSASNFWPEVERTRATAVLLVSTMLTIVPAQPDTPASRRCFGQLRLVFGAPLTAELAQTWKARFGPTHVSMVGYSMTEAFSMVANRIDNTTLPDGASGRRYADFDVRIVDDDDNECPAGTAGEVIVRPTKSGIMFQGYWRRPEATVAALRDLWFRTGDIGRFDEQGYFYFVDRKKDYVRRGGENISSFEVEAVFLRHEALAEVAIHAVVSDEAEDEVKLTAVLEDGATISADELCRWSESRLPRFAVPRYIEFVPSLPRTPTNRVQKYLLKQRGVTPDSWDRRAAASDQLRLDPGR